MDKADLLVIGAGPAGMAAAATATSAGIAVTILDEQPATGGQIYRAIESASGPRRTGAPGRTANPRPDGRQ